MHAPVSLADGLAEGTPRGRHGARGHTLPLRCALAVLLHHGHHAGQRSPSTSNLQREKEHGVGVDVNHTRCSTHALFHGEGEGAHITDNTATAPSNSVWKSTSSVSACACTRSHQYRPVPSAQCA
jgi:hypothetical protein